jgi:hypothetical protein
MSWNPNSGKHRAMHGGYRGKPTKGAVNALLGLYAEVKKCNVVSITKKQEGVQLKFDFNGEGI